jgi:hypothetical protein
MNCLAIPVPETVTACYIVPLPDPMSEKTVRELAIKAARERLAAPLAGLVVNLLRDGHIELRVLNPRPGARRPESPLLDMVTDPEARALMEAAGYVVFSMIHRPSLAAMQELMASATAAAFAARLGVPMLNAEAEIAVDPGDALAVLPDTVNDAGGGIRIRAKLRRWVTFDELEHDGERWIGSDGMRRYGLPEFMLCGGERGDLRTPLTDLLCTVATRVWTDLADQATGPVLVLPPVVSLPAEMTIDGKLVGFSVHEGHRRWLRVWPLFDVDSLPATRKP